MASIDVGAACVDIEFGGDLEVAAGLTINLGSLEIVFPGGVVLAIGAPSGADVAFALDYGKQAIASVNAALMPLQPIFSIIDTLLAVFECVKAVPDSISSLDPGKVTASIPKLAAKIDNLLLLLPPLSIPKLVKGTVNVAIVFFVGIRAQLQAAVDALAKAQIAEDRANEIQAFALAGVPGFSLEAGIQLQLGCDCARATAAACVKSAGTSAAPIGSLLGIIRAFVSLVGLPVKIPDLSNLGDDAEAAVVAVDALIALLAGVSVAIVV